MSLPFLLEIGTEEIPDWMIPGALENLRALFEEALRKGVERRSRGRAGRWDVPSSGSSRRRACPERQADSGDAGNRPVRKLHLVHYNWQDDPAVRQDSRKSRALDAGSTAGLQSHAQRASITVTQRKPPGGRPAKFWPKRCRASSSRSTSRRRCIGPGKNGPRFIRPIRWIVSLLSGAVVPFEIAGVPSGNSTTGHRILGSPTHPGHDRKLRAHAARRRLSCSPPAPDARRSARRSRHFIRIHARIAHSKTRSCT